MTARITTNCGIPDCPPVTVTADQVRGFTDDQHRYAISYDCTTCGNTTYKDLDPEQAAQLIWVGVEFVNDNPIPAREIRDFDKALGAVDTLVDRLQREMTL